MRKLVTTLVLAMTMLTMAGCGKKIDNRPKIVCTTFPQYDWVQQILGDKLNNFNLIVLQDNAVDMHSYQPSAEDIVNVEDSQLFIKVGGESDVWSDSLKIKNSFSLIDALGDMVKEEEVKEGMEAEDSKTEDSEAEDSKIENSGEIDEHVWLSLRNAMRILPSLALKLGEIDEDNVKYYQENANAYVEKLYKLDREYLDKFCNMKCNTIVVGDRFPFRYLMDDYGIDYFAAFVGCSAETEASFDTITFLANKIEDLALDYVFVLEGSDHKIAESVQRASSRPTEIIGLNSMQSGTSKDFEKYSYYDVMKKNLETLERVLC